MFELEVEGHFSAAHSLRGYQGKCEKLHGHNWLVRLTLGGNVVNDQGMLIDFHEARELLARSIAGCDHANLNELEQFKTLNPTTENVARIVCERVAAEVPAGITVRRVTVWETAGNCATYSP